MDYIFVSLAQKRDTYNNQLKSNKIVFCKFDYKPFMIAPQQKYQLESLIPLTGRKKTALNRHQGCFYPAKNYSAAIAASADKISNSFLVASGALILLQMAYSFASRSSACS